MPILIPSGLPSAIHLNRDNMTTRHGETNSYGSFQGHFSKSKASIHKVLPFNASMHFALSAYQGTKILVAQLCSI